MVVIGVLWFLTRCVGGGISSRPPTISVCCSVVHPAHRPGGVPVLCSHSRPDRELTSTHSSSCGFREHVNLKVGKSHVDGGMVWGDPSGLESGGDQDADLGASPVSWIEHAQSSSVSQTFAGRSSWVLVTVPSLVERVVEPGDRQ